MIFGFVILAIVIGALMPLQAGLNAELTRYLKHPYLAALISLTSGAIAISILVIMNGGFNEIKRLNAVPPHLLMGGVLGAIFVSSSLFFIPRMGATTMIASFITGQLIGSVIIDHFGFMGLTPTPVSIEKFVGIILLFSGLFLVIRKTT